jgi:chaperone modulatory protein CbpM
MTAPRYLPARPHAGRLELEEFARRCGLHPGLVRRFVALGLVPAVRDRNGRLWFGRPQVAAVARLQRLRATLPLNYAALGLVVDLLDRIERLETALRIRGQVEPVRPAAPARTLAAQAPGGQAAPPRSTAQSTAAESSTAPSSTAQQTTAQPTTGRPTTADHQEERTRPWT